MTNKLGSILDSAWNWLVTSSVNPSQTSLTVRGFLATGISAIIAITGAVHAQVPGLSDNLNAIADQIALAVQYALGIVGVVSFVIGAVRKIVVSLKSYFNVA